MLAVKAAETMKNYKTPIVNETIVEHQQLDLFIFYLNIILTMFYYEKKKT